MGGINTNIAGYQSGQAFMHQAQNSTQRFDKDIKATVSKAFSFGEMMQQKMALESTGVQVGGKGKYYEKTVSGPARGQGAVPRTYQVYLLDDDMLYSGGNGSGLSFYLKYAEGSTEEDPTVIAKGVDENGKEFQKTIHINKINPRHATLVEMRALEAHLGVDKNGGLSSLPMDPDMGNMGLNDKADFIGMFQKVIRHMKILGQKNAEAYYRYSLRMYSEFMEKRTAAGKV